MVARDVPALGAGCFPSRRRPGRGGVHGRARACHASSRVATRARWDTPPRDDDDAFLFWETPRARALRDEDRGAADVARSAPRLAVDRSRASGARASATPGLPSVSKPVARARVRDVHPDGCLPSGQSAKAFRFFSREIGARRAGRVPRPFTGARSEAEPNRESRRSREARASRVEPAAREAETCRTCEYPRASASRIPRTASRVSAHVALPRATRSAPAELQFASGRNQPSPRPLLADLIPRSTPPRALDP